MLSSAYAHICSDGTGGVQEESTRIENIEIVVVTVMAGWGIRFVLVQMRYWWL